MIAQGNPTCLIHVLWCVVVFYSSASVITVLKCDLLLNATQFEFQFFPPLRWFFLNIGKHMIAFWLVWQMYEKRIAWPRSTLVAHMSQGPAANIGMVCKIQSQTGLFVWQVYGVKEFRLSWKFADLTNSDLVASAIFVWYCRHLNCQTALTIPALTWRRFCPINL